jgi:formylglycine-generating enzyme required for sulfatase activity
LVALGLYLRAAHRPHDSGAIPTGVRPTGMTLIPGGDYTLGETGAKATIRPFYLDITEVTVASFRSCVERGACTAPNTDNAACNDGNPDRVRHPINCVDWVQADAFCKAFGKRLPSEEEWEWAARGGERGWAYPWGDEPPLALACWNGEGNDEGKGRRTSTCGVGDRMTKSDPWDGARSRRQRLGMDGDEVRRHYLRGTGRELVHGRAGEA